MNHYANWGNALKGLFRISQTTTVLAATGIAWAAGERPPLPRLLRLTFERLGATYVKLGQIVASSPGVFPEVLSNEFRTLLDRVPPADPALIRQVLIDQLGTFHVE